MSPSPSDHQLHSPGNQSPLIQPPTHLWIPAREVKWSLNLIQVNSRIIKTRFVLVKPILLLDILESYLRYSLNKIEKSLNKTYVAICI